MRPREGDELFKHNLHQIRTYMYLLLLRGDILLLPFSLLHDPKKIGYSTDKIDRKITRHTMEKYSNFL